LWAQAITSASGELVSGGALPAGASTIIESSRNGAPAVTLANLLENSP
jgi:hypothetical protein